jgi:uncharacterized protein (UPF0332 family)
MNFCLLIFGHLGKSALISLQSILNLNPTKVCVLGDSSGLDWLLKSVPDSHRDSICIHNPPSKETFELNLNLSHEYYSEFGKERFIKLTTFKWYLLLDALNKHGAIKQFIFSDLDVFWLNIPEPNIFLQAKFKDNNVIAQDDTPKGSAKKHFCTGIMFWTNNSESKKLLDALFQYQLKSNLEGTLDDRTYVIGHRFFYLVIPFIFRFQNLHAFHANYVIGERAKFKRLRIVQLRHKGNYIWYFLFLSELLSFVISKLTKNFHRLILK